jgi:hypothetical protein
MEIVEIVCIVYGISRRLVPVPERFVEAEKGSLKKLKHSLIFR